MADSNSSFDVDLVKRLRRDDESAFKVIFYKWSNKLYHFSFKYLKNHELSEEIVQETLLQLWINRANFDEKYPLSPYLFTIAKRLSLNSLRQIAQSKTASNLLLSNMKEAINTTEEAISLAELKQITEEALQLMPKKQQQVYRLSRNEGLSLDEIALELGIFKNTVKKHLSEALKDIRKYYLIKYHLIFFSFFLFLKK